MKAGWVIVVCQLSFENNPFTETPMPGVKPAGGFGSYGISRLVAEVWTLNCTSNLSLTAGFALRTLMPLIFPEEGWVVAVAVGVMAGVGVFVGALVGAVVDVGIGVAVLVDVGREVAVEDGCGVDV